MLRGWLLSFCFAEMETKAQGGGWQSDGKPRDFAEWPVFSLSPPARAQVRSLLGPGQGGVHSDQRDGFRGLSWVIRTWRHLGRQLSLML